MKKKDADRLYALQSVTAEMDRVLFHAAVRGELTDEDRVKLKGYARFILERSQ